MKMKKSLSAKTSKRQATRSVKVAKPKELLLSKLGKRAKCIPAKDPVLVVRLNAVGSDDRARAGRIIPVCEPLLMGNEERYLMQTVRTNWISSAGSFISDFENLFAEKVGAKYGVACANGTVALHLALAALGIGPGDQVIVPTFTMIASANAVTYTGAEPVFIDSEKETWNLNVKQIESLITKRTRAIMPMHTYGHPVDMEPLLALAAKYDLSVVCDSAEAHGALYKGQALGGLGDVATYSFYGNKIITTGEGGMLTTNNRELAEVARNMRDHSFSKDRHFWHRYVGFNYRMTNMQAAVGLAQTENFDHLVSLRRNNAQRYSSKLKGLKGLVLPPEKSWAKNVFWMYGVLVKPEFGMTRDQLRQHLAERGIETRTFFIPLHLQPVYFEQHGDKSHPISEMLCEYGMYLPSGSGLTTHEIDYIARSVIEIQKSAR